MIFHLSDEISCEYAKYNTFPLLLVRYGYRQLDVSVTILVLNTTSKSLCLIQHNIILNLSPDLAVASTVPVDI